MLKNRIKNPEEWEKRKKNVINNMITKGKEYIANSQKENPKKAQYDVNFC